MRYIAGLYSIAVFLLLGIAVVIGAATGSFEMYADMWAIFIMFVLGVGVNIASIFKDGREWS
ncbi:hypothetical protein ABR763_01290 [Bacillus cereus]